MRIFLRILGILFILIVVAVAAILIYLFAALPKKETPQEITVQANLETIARGEYLARNVTVCLHCHSDRKTQYFGTPPIPGTEGKGSLFIKQKGLGEMYSPNITPHALGNWTDGELIRAIIQGVTKDGDPLFPIMPYKVYAHLKQEDLHAIVSYIRSLTPIANEVPRTKLDFPLNLVVRMIPGPTEPDTKAQSDPGNYLARIAGCIDCHTPINDRGEPLPGMTLAGGQKFGNAQSGNITPDMETGIGKWTKEDFLTAFRKWQDPALQQIAVSEDQNTVMPWISYSRMKEEDLSAIYDYLRTVPAIQHRVEKFQQPAAAAP